MIRRRLGAIAVSLAMAVTATACGGGDDDGDAGGGAGGGTTPAGGALTVATLPTVSAQLTDFPSGYAPKAGFPKQLGSPAECAQNTAPEDVALASRLQGVGLQACYLAVYSKERGNDSNSPGSGTFLFGDATGAQSALPLLRQAIVGSLRPSGVATLRSTDDIPVSGLGEQSVPGVRFTIGVGGTRSFRLLFYFWRTGNMVAYVGGGDSLGDLNESAYLDLARKVNARAAR